MASARSYGQGSFARVRQLCKWVIVLMICLPCLSACEGARAAREPLGRATAAPATPAVPTHARDLVAISPPQQEPDAAGRSSSRTIDSDFDADGIADYRIIISEAFDAAGSLISRTEEEDFEADGIVDTRVTTNFGQ